MVKILAPAKSYEGCAAAFNAGAHGVYLGAKTWSRGATGHAISDLEIAECIGLAKSRKKLVHIAVNTIPGYRDTGLFVEKCLSYNSLGVDGLILNDFGLIAKLLSVDRGAPVYASVGCGITNIADVRFYLGLGVTGMVLQPGILPDDVKRIKDKHGVKVEIFCEVLLEPFLFGKCWLGSYCSLARKNVEGKECFLGSAKRGGCSKGCKASWEVFRGKDLLTGSYELSFEHYSLLTSLKAYIAAGVDIIKIQGRDRSPEVIADTVKVYKNVLGGNEH